MKIYVELLQFLSAPLSSGQGQGNNYKGGPELLLESLISDCLGKLQPSSRYETLLLNAGPISSSWKFTCWIADFLLQLKETVELVEAGQSEEDKSIEVLSIQSQLNFQKVVELLVGFGLVPYLLLGVGIPEKLRKKNHLAVELFSLEDIKLPPVIQFHRLAQVLETLVELTLHPSFHALIVPKHSADILAGLLQICKSPLAKPIQMVAEESDDVESSSKPKPKPGALSIEEYNYVLSIRQRLLSLMDHTFLLNLPSGLLINALFLIGATEKPKWIRTSCNQLLYDILLSPDGLVIISTTLLNQSNSSNIWKLARVISNLMRGALLGVKGEKFTVKLESLCKQCLRMILSLKSSELRVLSPNQLGGEIDNTTDKGEPNTATNEAGLSTSGNQDPITARRLTEFNKELSRIGIFSSLVLMDLDSRSTQTLIWNRIFNCLIQFKEVHTTTIETTSSSCPSAYADLVINCAEIVESLLSLVLPASACLPLQSFQPNWSILFQIYVACKAYLEKKVQEPLVAQFAQELASKLENIILLLLEIVSFGAGDSLDVNYNVDNSSTSKDKSNQSNDSGNVSKANSKYNPYIGKSKTSAEKQDNNIPTNEERLKDVAEFCIKLMLNEIVEKEDIEDNFATSGRVNKFALVVEESSENEKGKERVKIVLVASQSVGPSDVDGQFEQQQEDDNDNLFELLSDECTILCACILRHERMSHITSRLFKYFLNFSNAGDRNVETSFNDKTPRKKTKGPPLKEQSLQSSNPCSSSGSLTETQDLLSNPCKLISGELAQLEMELEDKGSSAGGIASARKFVALKLLSDLGEDESILESYILQANDFKETLSFLHIIMKKLANELEESSALGEDYEFCQTVIFALGTLGTVVETAAGQATPISRSRPNGQSFNNSEPSSSISGKSNGDQETRDHSEGVSDIWEELRIFLPQLKVIQETDQHGLISIGIPTMAGSILSSISTRGVANTGFDRSSHLKSDKDRIQIVPSRYENTLLYVNSPLIPVKGHGLLELRRLIEEKDPETIKNESGLLEIFQQELFNGDSYVYLMAIQGFSALGLQFHKTVIPIIIAEYDLVNPETQKGSNETDQHEIKEKDQNKVSDKLKNYQRIKMYSSMTTEERIQLRMKIGEVLVKVIQRLGQVAPFYRIPLTNLFFRVVRDDEPLIRASALANLGELCHLLNYSLGVVLTEVWFCLESVLNCEKDLNVRRSALHLFVLLLKGVEKEMSVDQILQNVQVGTYIRDARRLLTRIEQQEKDDVCKTHAQLALQELELIVKKVLTPSSSLEYKIQI